jgi:hypothetical protein
MELWKKLYDGAGSGSDFGMALVADSAANVYVIGKSYYSPTNGFDIATIKYDSGGTQVWAKNFNGSSNDHDEAVAVDVDHTGNVIVLGTSYNTTTSADFQLIQYDPAGTQQWEKKYTRSNAAGSAEDAAALFVDPLDNIYVAGTSALDYGVVKYSTTVGISDGPLDASIVLFPNPSDGRFLVKSGSHPIEKMEVYNAVGMKMLTVFEGKEIDLSGLASGIYFVKIYGDGQVQTARAMKR